MTDSIRTREKIQWIGMRNEEAAAFAAGAEAPLLASWLYAPEAAGPETCI